MKRPLDKSLGQWIRELIAENRLYRFYKCDEFKAVRNIVLEKYHNECKHCMERGIYTPAKVVHHVNEVRERPDLALSLYYRDSNGEVKENLIPLCQNCHEIEHGRAYKGRKDDRPAVDETKWPERW